jgi:CBS domain-containing protein
MLLVRHLVRGRHKPHRLSADMTVIDAARFLRQHRIGGAPVLQEERLIGFCSERDLVFRVLAEGVDPAATRVDEVMTRELLTAHLDHSVEECEALLRKAHCRHLPIMDGDTLVDCLSLRDFLQSDLKQKEMELSQIKDYIQGSG